MYDDLHLPPYGLAQDAGVATATLQYMGGKWFTSIQGGGAEHRAIHTYGSKRPTPERRASVLRELGYELATRWEWNEIQTGDGWDLFAITRVQVAVRV